MLIIGPNNGNVSATTRSCDDHPEVMSSHPGDRKTNRKEMVKEQRSDSHWLIAEMNHYAMVREER